tara:strand:+ start:1649 stop:1879 length:231 start_codon:yes stop_codon:yes gene_type:complete
LDNLSSNPNSIALLEQHRDEIAWYNLSGNWKGMSYNSMDKGEQKWIRQHIQESLFEELLQNKILSDEVVRYIVSFV